MNTARALVGAALALLTAASYAPAFGRTPVEALTDRQFALPALGAVAVVTAVCLLLAAGTRLAPVSRVAVAVAALAGYVVLVAAPGPAVMSGPRRLLTSALPIEAGGPELATVVSMLGLAALGAVEPALRRRAALLPLLAPLVAASLGCAVSASAGPPAGWLAPAFVLGAGALLALARRAQRPVQAGRAEGEPGAGPVRRVLAGGVGALVLACTVAAGGYGPGLVPGRGEPADPRSLVPQPVTPREATSPLVLYPALRTGQQRLSLIVHTGHRPERLRYVSLDEFDGQYWTTGAQYQRAGQRLPLGPDQPAGPVRAEQVDVRLAGPLGWLVSSGRPVEVSVADLGVNEQSGDVVLPADRPVPAAYTVHSVLTEPDLDLLEVAAPVPAAPDPLLLSSAVGRDLHLRATEITGTARYGFPQLRALEEHLRTFTVDSRPDAPSGHGLAQIDALLSDGTGTAEQYASAFAVLARTLGYQSRVVVGFRPREVAGQPGSYEVSERDVHAWPEVRFESAGWVRFEPTPTVESDNERDPGEAPEDPVDPFDPDLGDQDAPPPDAGGGPGGGASGVDPVRIAGLAGVVLAVVLAVVAALAAAVPLVKRTRRWRRWGRESANLRVLGAWREALDQLVEAGETVREADTSGEVVAIAGRRFGDRVAQPLRELARLADAAAYAPASLDDPAAQAAWRHADLVRRGVQRALSRYRRMRATLNPRPLLRSF